MEQAQRFSKKRQAIYDALLCSKDHPSAEHIYQQLKAEYPDLSLGTVYRNIKGMVESGDVICVGNVDGKDRFDANIATHAHLVCRECGAVMDLDIPREMADQCHSMEVQNSIQLDLGSLHFEGLCQMCRARGEAAPVTH